jgi:hypothetical protein
MRISWWVEDEREFKEQRSESKHRHCGFRFIILPEITSRCVISKNFSGSSRRHAVFEQFYGSCILVIFTIRRDVACQFCVCSNTRCSICGDS